MYNTQGCVTEEHRDLGTIKSLKELIHYQKAETDTQKLCTKEELNYILANFLFPFIQLFLPCHGRTYMWFAMVADPELQFSADSE